MKNITIMMVILCALYTQESTAISSGRASSFGSRSVSSPSRISSPNISKPVVNVSRPVSVKNETLFAKFKSNNTAPVQPRPASVDGIFNKSYRADRKREYYSGYTPAPVYKTVIVQHPNYGVFDAMLMWSMLDNMSDRKMYYNHQNEPAFQQWRTDADQLCRQGNLDICAKLSSLDDEVNDLKKQGITQDRTYITPDIDPNIYTTDGVNVKDLGEIKICTGSVNSDYTRFASSIGDKTKLTIKYISSNGSIDNLDKLSKGYCDLAFTQSDTLSNPELQRLLTLDTKEVAMLVCSRAKTVSELTDTTTIYVGSDQTGSQFTLNKLNLKGFVRNDMPIGDAAAKLDSTKDSCLFAVDTWNAPFIKQLDNKKEFHLVPILNTSGYQPVILDQGHYDTLTQNTYKGWFSGGTDTVAVSPVLVTTKSWMDANQTVVYDILISDKKDLQSTVK